MLPSLPSIMTAMHRPSREAIVAALEIPREGIERLTRDRPEPSPQGRPSPEARPTRDA